MSLDRVYIRFKGRVLGPLTQEKTMDMVKRGQITRQHELSSMPKFAGRRSGAGTRRCSAPPSSASALP
jgi:hypothetical protein